MQRMHECLDLDLLRALDALVRLRSVTAAGREIGLTQSATSHALSRLRAALGDAVLVRSARGMVPTARAEQLAERARRIVGEVDELATARATFEPATARRTFAIAMSDGGQLLALPPLLELLAREAPGITLVVQPPAADDARRLETGELAVRLGGTIDGANLYRQTLIDDELVWVVRAQRVAPRISLADLVARGRVRLASRGRDGVLERALAAAKLPMPATVTVHSLLAALMIVLRSQRVLAVTGETARALSKAMPIRAVTPAISYPKISIVQHWHARMHTDPGHSWLRQQIKAVADHKMWARAA